MRIQGVNRIQMAVVLVLEVGAVVLVNSIVLNSNSEYNYSNKKGKRLKLSSDYNHYQHLLPDITFYEHCH